MRDRSSGFKTIFKLILAMSIISLIIDSMGFFNRFAVLTLGVLIPLIFMCAMAMGFVAIIKGGNNKPKANLTDDLLELFNKISFDNNRVILDEESYLLITKNNNVTLEDIDIIVNEEYISNLQEFASSYPNSFNNLCNKVIKANKKRKKKNSKEEIIEEPIKTTIEKDCAYYIKKFHELDGQIETDSVKESIKETISYLNEIKRIEDEFGDSKNKTYKLYEYYLPMYTDILANYDRLHDNAPSSSEFKENETKLIKTSQLINSALKSITSSLTESYYTDLNVNMKTLESILKKDGLVQEKMETK